MECCIFQAGLAAAPARAVSAVKNMNMNISQQIKDIKLPDLPQAIKDLKFWYSQNPYVECTGSAGEDHNPL